MARIAGVDVPNNKQARIGLTYIFGIGNSRAAKILAKADVDPFAKLGTLDQAVRFDPPCTRRASGPAARSGSGPVAQQVSPGREADQPGDDQEDRRRLRNGVLPGERHARRGA